MKPEHVRHFKPYPAYKDSGVEWLGEIPAHWEVKRVKNAASRIGSGKTPSGGAEVYVSDGVMLLRSQNVQFAGLHLKDVAFIDSETDCEMAGSRVIEGDVLLNITGASLGRCCVARLHGQAANVNQHVCAIRPRNGVFESAFLAASLASGPVQGQIFNAEDGISRDALNFDQIGQLLVARPPVAEQRAIAAFLDRETTTIDALVAKNERLIELLREKRTALITRAVTSGLPAAAATAGLDPKITLLGTESSLFPEIPEGWRLRKLRRLITRVKRPAAVEPETEYQEIGIRSWGKGIFHKDPLRGALFEDKGVFYIKPNDFVLNIVFAWEGAVAVVSDSELGMVASHRFPTFRRTEEVDLDYLLLVLQSEKGRAVMAINSPGAAGRNRTIRLEEFLDEEVPVPPLAAQQEIVWTFRAEERRLDALLAKVRDAIDRLKELRTALLSAAVTGKIDVRAASAEAAAGLGGAA